MSDGATWLTKKSRLPDLWQDFLSRMDFCTLGMLIIDEIRHAPPKAPSYNIIGGAGTFAVLGARLFRPYPSSKKLGWTVHRGHDFPDALSREIDGWQTGLQWIETPERQTTRALNEYVEGKGAEYRAFRYTTQKLRIDETHLTDDMLRSKSFHMVCSPERCINLVQGILARRMALHHHERPIFVWEPVPDSCTTDALNAVKDAARYVTVVSPNLSELAALFVADETPEEEVQKIEQRCLTILDGEFGKTGGALVIRCGSKGSYLRSSTEHSMMPAYWTGPEAADKVVDPTGGGNQFLGGLCIGLQSDQLPSLTQLERGVVFGNIAASFAIEQVGVPQLSQKESAVELWNDDSVPERLNRYLERLGIPPI